LEDRAFAAQPVCEEAAGMGGQLGAAAGRAKGGDGEVRPQGDDAERSAA